jgi:hypothetical protein
VPEDTAPHETSRFALPAEMDERWAVVERVSNSHALKRSAKLRDLLFYLCHRCWVEEAEEIREHEIGVDVFQRPANYDSTQDTLVRVQASQLRKRLEKYFNEDGQSEPLILEIGRGSYVPVIHERHAAVPAAPVSAPIPEAVATRPNRGLVPALAALVAVLAGICLWLALRQTGGIEGSGLRRYWTSFAPQGQETTVVIADGALSAVQDILHRPIHLDEYVTRAYRAELDRPEHSAETKATLRYMMERRYTSLADVMLVRLLWAGRLVDPARTNIVYSRDLHLRSLQKGNHILVGSRRAVPWVDLFDSSLDFHFVYDEKSRGVSVENRRPRPGEPKSFTLTNPTERFSLVASLPNLSKQGSVLILSGQEMSGTEAAANLVTTESGLQSILSRLPPSAAGKVPHFEVLLRVRQVEYTTQGFEIVAVHGH